ncbi:thiol:disulfide interchange protein [Aliidiomarina taiwanensis]|uniref:Thiol:disulfide interchange protein n=1 Tax=Aliidiomarina taiwanensis TaxID=946228 RepID=A0A432XAB3_9GAMM|nr:thioredoxin fold domain-containing protein [Aliidiomarina taiwanensis]RUO44343.1 thiol:disulfide interchange protein [Aliidiomarina taiwanensis]
MRLNSRILGVSLLAISSLLSGVALSSEQPTEPELTPAIEQRLGQMGLQVERVREATELEGYMQVFTSQGAFYITHDGSRLIAGKVFSIEQMPPTDLTEQAVSQVRQALVRENADLTIKYPAMNEGYKVTIFTDHTCPYCRQLHEQMAGYQNLGISIEYLAFPRAGLEHSSATELNSIFCASNPADAMTRAMAGQKPRLSRCDQTMQQHLSLARQMGITGTPAIILPNGNLIPGFVPPERLLQELRASAR